MNKVKWKMLTIVASIVMIMLVPLIVKDEYTLTILDLVCIYVMLASSLNLLVGYTGQISFAHVAFYAIGGYTSTLLVTKLGWSFWLALPIAGLVAALVSIPVGFIVLRFRKHVFVLVTLSLSEIIRLMIYNFDSFTGGPNGIFNIPRPDNIQLFSFFWDFSTPSGIYWLLATVTILSVFSIRAIVKSSMGLALKSIRENETYASFSGINVSAYKNAAFIIGALFAGFAGSLYAHLIGYISPYAFTVAESINILLMIVFGGMGTILGPVIGAGLLVFLPEFLRSLADYRMLIYGALLVIVILFMPQGILGMVQSLWQRRPYSPEVTANNKVNGRG